MLLGVDPIGALAALGLERFNLVARIFQRPGHKTANRMGLPAHLLNDLGQCGTVLPPNPATPANEFQIVTKRSMGQLAVSVFRASWLAKDSPLAALTAAASLGCAVMLFSGSIVNVVIIVSPCCRARRS